MAQNLSVNSRTLSPGHSLTHLLPSIAFPLTPHFYPMHLITLYKFLMQHFTGSHILFATSLENLDLYDGLSSHICPPSFLCMFSLLVIYSPFISWYVIPPSSLLCVLPPFVCISPFFTLHAFLPSSVCIYISTSLRLKLLRGELRHLNFKINLLLYIFCFLRLERFLENWDSSTLQWTFFYSALLLPTTLTLSNGIIRLGNSTTSPLHLCFCLPTTSTLFRGI